MTIPLWTAWPPEFLPKHPIRPTWPVMCFTPGKTQSKSKSDKKSFAVSAEDSAGSAGQ